LLEETPKVVTWPVAVVTLKPMTAPAPPTSALVAVLKLLGAKVISTVSLALNQRRPISTAVVLLLASNWRASPI
jgi:xanthosine utilization system XapX-like protein